MKVIRYSDAFKMQAVREVEAGDLCAQAVQRKYNMKGNGRVLRWVRQLGSGKHGKIIRVERAEQVSEAVRLSPVTEPTAAGQGGPGRHPHGAGVGEVVSGGGLRADGPDGGGL